jgi:transposase
MSRAACPPRFAQRHRPSKGMSRAACPPRATLVRRDEQAVLISRALLVKIKRDIENQIRGLLKNLGLVIGRAKMNVFAMRAAELAQARPELGAAAEPLLKAREAVGQQIADLDRKVLRLARNNAQVRRFMTAPGVGPITALFFLATIDEPTRFKRSRSVGAYAGLTTRR